MTVPDGHPTRDVAPTFRAHGDGSPGLLSTWFAEGPPPVVYVHGEVDMSSRTQLYLAIARALAVTDGDLVVDLGSVGFMDSQGMSALAAAASASSGSDRRIVVRSASAAIRRMFDILGVPRDDGSGPRRLLTSGDATEALRYIGG